LALTAFALTLCAGQAAANDNKEFCAQEKAIGSQRVSSASLAQIEQNLGAARAALASIPKNAPASAKLWLGGYVHMAEYYRIVRQLEQPGIADDKKAQLRAELQKQRVAISNASPAMKKQEAGEFRQWLETTCPGNRRLVGEGTKGAGAVKTTPSAPGAQTGNTASAAGSSEDAQKDIRAAVAAFRKDGRDFSGAKLARGLGGCERIDAAALSKALGTAVEVGRKHDAGGATYRFCTLFAANTNSKVALFYVHVSTDPASEAKVIGNQVPWGRLVKSPGAPIEGLAERAAWRREEFFEFTRLLVREGTVEAVIEGRAWDRASNTYSFVSVPVLIDVLARMMAALAH
jgi:hypothetical protein